MTYYSRLLLSAAVFLGCSPAVRAVTPEEGRRIYLEAKEGNAEAQYRLGLCFLKGDGVKRSPSQAKFWFSKAARQGHRTAERSLRLIPKKAPLPVDPSADRATREKKGLELYEYLYKLKDYRPARRAQPPPSPSTARGSMTSCRNRERSRSCPKSALSSAPGRT